MLELEYPTLIGLYIRDVLLTVIVSVYNLLPVVWKLSFPSTVPFGFVFPPRVTGPIPSMRPMVNFYLATPSN